jgi:3-oxoacyl-[acyl-carrier-protein] synthase II
MIYIRAIQSITHQDSFNQENIWDNICVLGKDSNIIAPDYKNYISPSSLRRLSPVLRMALTAAKECQAQVGQEIDAISVGTSLGCLADTEKFLIGFHSATSDVFSPTAFIQSTHNTIAGLISLELKNHSYNMTHTQNSLSFEVALLDAIMCCREGSQNVLLGAADECIDFLKLLQPSLIENEMPLTSGVTFMILGGLNSRYGIGIQDILIHTESEDIEYVVNQFLQKHKLSIDNIDQFFVSGEEQTCFFSRSINYLQYSGLYFSAAAFALHLAHDWLRKERKKYALIINEIFKGKIGLMLIKRDEA